MDCLENFGIGEGLEARVGGDLFAERAKIGNGAADGFERGPTFRNYAGDGFVVAGDDDLLAAGDAVEDFTETGLGFEGAKG